MTGYMQQASRRFITLVGACALLLALVAAPPVSAQEAATPDGSSSSTAAASCWEIKQNDAAAPDGVYWLVTPTLQAPEQFYCDMTTNGGGWVLIARGREGWRTNYQGRGTPAEVRNVVTGTAAFDVKQLSSLTIDGLLDGGRVDALADGIRLRRATSADGSAWQEARFTFASRDRWVWTFAAEHRVGTYSFDGLSGSGGQTNNFGSNNSLRRVDTRQTQAQAWTHGWAYGSGVAGTNSSTSYLWSSTNGAGAARPFTQVYLRPQLRRSQLQFPTVPDSGTPEQELSPLLGNGVLPGAWGVTGLANGQVSELAPEVSAFAQSGNRVYVSGNFRYVQRGQNPSGADRVEQSYLAAFDVNTGDWLSDFRPQFNQQVKSLAALPDGTLVAGGEFTQANGQPATGVVRLNPTTGATASGWGLQLENRLSGGGPVNVRALDVQGNWLYLGGLFTHVRGGSSNAVYAKMAARFSVTNGAPDTTWNPELSGSVIDLDASADGTRVYASGYFDTAKGITARKAVALNATGATLVSPAWNPVFSASASYQQAVQEVGGRVWLGGSEHSLFSYDRNTFQRLSGNITKQGGDFQAIGTANGIVYASCHCNEWNYSNAFTWSNVGTNWTQADKIGFVGAWNGTTGEVDPEFNPTMNARQGYGPWAIFTDSTGNVWFGGDLVSVLRANGTSQWVGGFARFAPRDTDAPTAPTGLTRNALTEQELTLSWGGSGGGGVSYEVLLGGRVVATTNQTNLTLPAPTEPSRYFVRAIDATGNRSASSQVLTVTPDTDTTVELVAAGSSWRWQYVAGAWPEGWTQAGFDDSGWAQGAAPLGFGATGLGTNIDVPPPTSNRPISAQFRQQFEVEDVSQLSSASLTTIADDGVVVYVNGTEVGRANMPSGTLTSTTWPTGAQRTSVARANPVTFPVPPALLQDGTNVVTASMHLGWRATPDVSFDLAMTAE